jgi:hypothetical protein
MKLNDARLQVIAIERQCNPLVVSAIAGMIQDGISVEEGASFCRKCPEAMRSIWTEVADLIRVDKDRRAGAKVKRNPTAKVKMPSDWEPSEANREYAKALGMDDVQITNEGLHFRAYWKERGDARNWSLTWQNWIRRNVERVKANMPPAPPSAAPDAITLDQWRTAYSNFNNFGNWPASYGPEPGEPGCKMPPEAMKPKVK